MTRESDHAINKGSNQVRLISHGMNVCGGQDNYMHVWFVGEKMQTYLST